MGNIPDIPLSGKLSIAINIFSLIGLQLGCEGPPVIFVNVLIVFPLVFSLSSPCFLLVFSLFPLTVFRYFLPFPPVFSPF